MRSLHVKEPLINLRLFKNLPFDLHMTTFLIIQIVNVGFAFVLPNYLQLVNHTSSLTAGLLLLPGAALGACMAPMSGKLYDKLGPGRPIFIGLCLQLIGIVWLLLEALTAAPVIVLIGYAFIMLGTGFSMGNIMTSGQAQLHQEQTTDAMPSSTPYNNSPVHLALRSSHSSWRWLKPVQPLLTTLPSVRNMRLVSSCY